MPEELPPLVQLPESNLSADSLAQIAHSADWAQTFGEGDTNIVQRARHNADLTDYAKALAGQRAQAQYDLLQKNQVAQNLWLNTQKLQMQEQAHAAKLAHDAAMAPLQVQHLQSQIAAQQAAEQRQLKEAALNNLVQSHQDGFFADRADFLTANPSATQEQIDANDISLNGRYPHAMKSPAVKEIVQPATRNSLARQAEARKVDALTAQNEQAAKDAADAGLEFKGVSTSGAHLYGKPAAQQTAAEKVAEAEAIAKARAQGTAAGHTPQDDASKRLTHLENLRMKPNVDKDVKTYLDAEISKLKTATPAAPVVNPPAATPAPVPVVKWTRDENGNPVRAQ